MCILDMSDQFGNFYGLITAESLKLKLENFTVAVGPISKMFPISNTQDKCVWPYCLTALFGHNSHIWRKQENFGSLEIRKCRKKCDN